MTHAAAAAMLHVHAQVFFSSRNPLLRWKLPLLHKLLYNNGTWSYFCTIITTWTFLLVPFISLMFEIQPVKFGPEFALAASLYLFSNFVVSLKSAYQAGSWSLAV
jgi:hypothetical protein